MELLSKSRDELWEIGKKLKLDVAKNISTDDLMDAIESEAIRRTVEMEENARLKLKAEAQTRRDIADIQAEAKLRGIQVDIPAEPTLTDILGLKKKLNLMIKEPKPSPETLAIESSKKVYAIFHNREQDDMDVTINVGGKYNFHFWPEKVHIIPEYLIGYLRRKASYPVYGKKMVPNPNSLETGAMIETTGKVATKKRFLFEVLGDAPEGSSFGVILDKEILSQFKQLAD